MVGNSVDACISCTSFTGICVWVQREASFAQKSMPKFIQVTSIFLVLRYFYVLKKTIMEKQFIAFVKEIRGPALA